MPYLPKKQADMAVEIHRESCKKLGYAFFEKGNHNLNLCAERTGEVFTNRLTDKFRLIYKEDGDWRVLECDWTTLAGTKGKGGEQQPLNGVETGTGVSGTAILVPFQYRSTFKLTRTPFFFGNTYYFGQIGNGLYWRDDNRDGRITKGKIYEGNYLTHLHPMSPPKDYKRDYINSDLPGDQYSMGCQGARWRDFHMITTAAQKTTSTWGDVFTYTLFDTGELVS